MFTGLVQAIGTVRTLEPLDGRGIAGGARLSVDPGRWQHGARAGDSIAVNGCCLTVAGSPEAGGLLRFDAVAETLARTTLGGLRRGSRVNLERALAAGEPLGGHLVQGHIEGVAEVVSVQQGADYRIQLRPPSELMPSIVPKGSVTVDGVSLTVAAVDPAAETFAVAIIPTTLELTTLGSLRTGSSCNIETDMLARTVVHWLEHYSKR